MSLYWYTCISINTYCYEIYHILLEMVWWVLSNTSLIIQIHLAVHEILASEAFIVTDNLISWLFIVTFCHIQVHLSGNNIPVVKPPLNHTSLPFMVATFLTTCLMVVLQPSRYYIFHGRDTPILLGLPWRSYSYQCLNTETSTWGNRGFTTETPSISYTISLYIRLVVTL